MEINTSPEFGKKVFTCPHCNTPSEQKWFKVGLTPTSGPNIATEVAQNHFVSKCALCNKYSLWESSIETEKERLKNLPATPLRISTDSFMSLEDKNIKIFGDYLNKYEYELISLCGVLNKKPNELSTLLYPITGKAPAPHKDLPHEEKKIYNEAKSIHQKSPRAAAALLRLLLEMLIKNLEEIPKAHNDDLCTRINYLYKHKNTIDSDTYKMMHSLRILGNESIHPGTINLTEDQNTTNALFILINDITEETIAKNKRRKEIWDFIPEIKKEKL